MQIFTNNYQQYSNYPVITPSTTTINGQTVSPRFVQREGTDNNVKDTFVISGFSGKILLKLSQIPKPNIIISEGSNTYTEVDNENLVDSKTFYYKGKGYVLIYILDNSTHTIDVQYTGMGSLISAEDIWELQSGNLLNDVFTVPKNLIVNEDTTIKGNLFIYGTLETVDLSQTNELRVLDKYIYLNYGKTYNSNTDYGIAINNNDISTFKLNFNNDLFSLQHYNGSSYDTYFNASSLAINLNKNVSISGKLTVSNAITPSVGNSPNNGIYFPTNPGGGSGDEAFIRYFVEYGETTKLLIGINNDSDDRLSLYQYGAERLTIYNGNVGIGITSPSEKLHVAGNVGISAGTNVFIGTKDNYALSLRTNNTDRIFIDASGNVGIGTTSPGAKLEVKAGSENQASPVTAIKIWGPNQPTNSNSAQDLIWSFSSAGSAKIRGYRDSSWGTHLQFLTNSQSQGSDNPQVRMHISENGNVGIGTTSPAYKLDVVGSARISSGVSGIYLTNGRVWSENNALQLVGNNTSVWLGNLVNSPVLSVVSGNVGIDTTSPSEKLDVVGNVRLSGNLLIGNGTAGNKTIIANNADTNKPQIRYNDTSKSWEYTNNGSTWMPFSSGNPGGFNGQIQFNDNGILGGANIYYDKTTTNIGVGTSTPESKLDVAGNVIIRGNSAVSDKYLFVDNGSNNKPYIGYNGQWILSPDGITQYLILFTLGIGYFGGGSSSSSSSSNEIDGINFSIEASINPSATLVIARNGLAGVNSSIRGYFGGGVTATSYINEIDGIEFSTETAINPSATLAVARCELAGVNSSIKGYFGGGYNINGYSNEIDGIEFNTETAINPSATLAVARDYLAGVNSNIRGYFGGGLNVNGYSNEIDGIEFNTETAINPSATLAVARYALAGVNSNIRGYFGGGHNANGYSNEIDGIEFNTETAINPSATLAVARYALAGVNSNIRGYFGGGYNINGYSNEIDGIDFNTEAAINPSATLAVARYGLAGIQYGWR